MARPRSAKVESRNVKLDITTYERLDSYLLELMTARGNRKLYLGDAVAALLDEHESKISKGK